MLPLPVPAVPTGALHGLLQLAGSKRCRSLHSAVVVSLCRPLQRCVYTILLSTVSGNKSNSLRWMKLYIFLHLQATTPLWTCTQSSIASPRIRLFTQSLKADLLVCVWEKSGTASPAASCYRTSQYPGLHLIKCEKCILLFPGVTVSFAESFS